jgi:nitrate/nitrite transport system ATP-binding protein
MDIQSKLKPTIVTITQDVDEAVLLADDAATTGEDLHVDLPRPRRSLALAQNAACINARKFILSFLYDRFSHSAEAA